MQHSVEDQYGSTWYVEYDPTLESFTARRHTREPQPVECQGCYARPPKPDPGRHCYRCPIDTYTDRQWEVEIGVDGGLDLLDLTEKLAKHDLRLPPQIVGELINDLLRESRLPKEAQRQIEDWVASLTK